MSEPLPKPTFELGRVVATPNVLEHLSEPDIRLALRRHAGGDWGELDRQDQMANEQALHDGSRLLSAYRAKDGTKFWIITDAQDDHGHRLATTILLPSDY